MQKVDSLDNRHGSKALRQLDVLRIAEPPWCKCMLAPLKNNSLPAGSPKDLKYSSEFDDFVACFQRNTPDVSVLKNPAIPL